MLTDRGRDSPQVVLQDIQPGGMTRVFGLPFPVSSQWAYWAELVVIQVLVPNASFLGHLCGILAGQLYVGSGGFALLPAARAYFTPRRRYNDVVGQARRRPDSPRVDDRHARAGNLGGDEVEVVDLVGADADPEVIDVPPTDPIDHDAVRRARVARFGAEPQRDNGVHRRQAQQGRPHPPRFTGSGVLGRR